MSQIVDILFGFGEVRCDCLLVTEEEADADEGEGNVNPCAESRCFG